MKKILFLGILLSSAMVCAQEAEERIVAKDMLEGTTFEELLPFTNMKIFRDRQIMKQVITKLYVQEAILRDSDDAKVKVNPGIFSEEDSKTLEGAMNKGLIHHNLDEEAFNKLLEKTDEDPEAAFKELMLNSSIVKISAEERKKLNQVDEGALTRTLEMMTESGPDVGAKTVPVLYNNEAQK